MVTTHQGVRTKHGGENEQNQRATTIQINDSTMGTDQTPLITTPTIPAKTLARRRKYIPLSLWLRRRAEKDEEGQQAREQPNPRGTTQEQGQASRRPERPTFHFTPTLTSWRKKIIDETDGQKAKYQEIYRNFPNIRWTTEEAPTQTRGHQERLKPSNQYKTPPIDIPIPPHWDDDEKLAYATRKLSIAPQKSCATLV